MKRSPEQEQALEALRRKREEYDDWRYSWPDRIREMRRRLKDEYTESFEDLAYEAEVAGCSIAQIADAYGTSNWKTANTLVNRATQRRSPEKYGSDEYRSNLEQRPGNQGD